MGWLRLGLVFVVACGPGGGGTDAAVDAEAGPRDAADVDADSAPDVSVDTGFGDAGLGDAGLADAGLGDAGLGDGGADATLDGGPRPTGFVEVTAAAGLSYEHWPLGCPAFCAFDNVRACEATTMTGGVAAGDYDGDGATDLFVTRYEARDLLFRNRGDGTFEEVGRAAGLTGLRRTNGAAFLDIDRDGDLDLWVSALGGPRRLLFVNAGDGTFTEEATARGVAQEDGADHYAFSPCPGDFDGDGYVDVATTEWRPNPSEGPVPPAHARLYRNLGVSSPGHFEDVTVARGVEYEPPESGGVWVFTTDFVDLDRDGRLDLLVAADFGTSRLFWNEPAGFRDGTAAAGLGGEENGMGTALADFDGDARLDWFVSAIFDDRDPIPGFWGGSGNRLYRGQAGGSFVDDTDRAGVREGGWGWGAAPLDLDDDGHVDLALTNGMDFCDGPAPYPDDPTRLWRNAGDGTFAEVSAALGPRHDGIGRALVTLDHDLDGDQDLFIVDHAGGGHLFENIVAGGASLRVRLAPAPGAPSGRAARVEVRVEAGDVPRLGRLGSCGFLAQGDSVAHFGLGARRAGAEVRVFWPGGTHTVLTDMAAGVVTVSPP